MAETLHREQHGRVLVLTIDRPAKRNALDQTTASAIADAVGGAPDDIGCVVLAANGPHFSAGLDLNELHETDAVGALTHSRRWHRLMDQVQFGAVPVVSALHGAVIGGGFEVAAATHVRVADTSTYFALPEGARGIYVGGGGTARLPRLMGTALMTDMMLTGRVLTAEEGERAGIVQYLVGEGQATEKAIKIAERIAGNARMTNFALTQMLPRMHDAGQEAALVTESLMVAVAQQDTEARSRLGDFLSGRSERVRPAGGGEEDA
ncbi:crotonase/enoyl-CoA hydratase family protein [Georgenia sp. Z1344]|uniref:crotonase/enoyl-CoA hydratase family protein n=1 Tax=Georgenia sp. Z1344 TaxID=3416706 RepID=UPI003CF4FC0C